MAKPELGSKRLCTNCGAKFYDLNRNPIVCPKCGTPFQAAAPTRVAAPVAAARAQPVDDEVETDVAGPELVSLEEVEADETAKDTPADDIDIVEEEEAATDDAFLEEEEEGEDDVADLIDGDIEDDEET